MTATLSTGLGTHQRGSVLASRVLAAAAPDLVTHERVNGPLPWQGGARRLIAAVQRSGLTGRGGAGFPMWRKLAAVADGARPIVVGNGAEGEPASGKDALLLRHAPHLVLDGLQLVAEAVGAAECYLYAPAVAVAPLEAVLATRRGRDRVRCEVVEAPRAFVAGEESAVVSRLSGGPALPRDKAARVTERGIRDRPTLVQNVETLAHLALVARHGPGWLREYGTDDEPGTFLATVSGAVATPAVYEAGYGVPLRTLLDAAGGVRDPRAVLVGGYHGTWLSPLEVSTAALSRTALRPLGASVGAGVVAVLAPSACGLRESARIVAYLAGEAAGQCGPCTFGLPGIADALQRLAFSDVRALVGPQLVERIGRFTGLVRGRGACHHPDGTARFVDSAMRVFADEVRVHLAGGCTAATIGGTR
jgi:NADH:ubiquinone oxidoreductase subunit F (NADH-binding)